MNKRNPRLMMTGLALAAGLAAALPAHAQTAPSAAPSTAPSAADEALEVYNGRPIRAIVLREPRGRTAQGEREYGELTPENEQRARNNIRSWSGDEFNLTEVRRDISRLSRLGVFGRVEVRAQLLDDGSVDVFFDLSVQPIVRDVQVSGNRSLTDQELAGAVDIRVDEPIDRLRIDRAARLIEEAYRDKGFYLVEVVVDEDELDRGIVLYRINERERVRVTGIQFEGNQTYTPRELRRHVETDIAGLFQRGRLDTRQLDSDVQSLARFYADRGYLDARADYSFQLAPDGREAVVTFFVDEGPVYVLRDVRIEVADEDAAVMAPAQVKGLMDLKSGDVYSASQLRRAVNTIRDAYRQMGYADVQLELFPLRRETTPEVDLLLAVREGEPSRTGQIVIRGNELTKKQVLLRQIEIRPERPLDATAIEASERRLRQTRLYDPQTVRVTIQDPDPREPGYRDVLVEVDETNTAEFNFGGAVSSDSGLVGSISLTNRNFDIADLPDSPSEFFSGRAFRGAGQTFSLQALPGDRIQTYAVSFSEPYILESDYSGSAQVFFRDREFDEFDEQRIGTRLRVGRRFGTRWTGNLTLRAENVEISNIAEDRPTDFFDSAEKEGLTTLGVSFTRSTLDSPFLPTRGSASEVSVEQAGVLGGDWTYTKFEAGHEVYLTLLEDFDQRRTVISWNTRVGYIPQGREDTPVFERFYLGGRSLRGLEFRTVSPRGVRQDNGEPADEPVGGTWQFSTSLELRQPVVGDTVFLVGFVDIGTVTFDPGFEDLRVSVGMGVRVRVPQLSPAPLAFDFGFPIAKEDEDEGRLFTFSVDVPFR